MWKHIFVPTLFVIVLWVVFSGLTTWYIHWQDVQQARLLEENVSSMRATGAMQELVWQMQAVAFDERISSASRQTRLKGLESAFQQALRQARRAALAPQEPPIIDKIDRTFRLFRARIHATANGEDTGAKPEELQGTVHSAEAVAEQCHALLHFNEDYLKRAAAKREALSSLVFFTRTFVLIIGPAIGIWLGWRIARELNRRISEISITLKDAAGQIDHEIGRVALSHNLDLPDLGKQVQTVSHRIRQVVDELNQTRQEVLRRERLAAVGELAAGVAHELRNPMTSVKLLLQSAAQRSKATGTDKQFQVILDEFARMENTIQGLLDFARPPQLRRVQHDVRQTVRRALNLIEGRAKQQNVTLDTQSCDEPLVMDGDPEQLHQVFINVLLNALESMPEGGTLTVAAAPTPDGAFARVRLADTGAGIPPEVLLKIFEPFVTTKERGVGLGLAISRRIIHDHQGLMWCENPPTGGALFTVELPLVAPLPAAVPDAVDGELAGIVAATA